ncbi:Predicted nucleotide-binding protein containing TIR-like domain-containing protein [Paenibacillus polysaccharolyticus]|uniref:Predicted nucleotide-binding protein containing TIR-like domain-containing protein n=1 Tax=Paenibacillus polysaccharolyticus TaxID=582692 RepID=A0A1G5KJ51_9BACL|nr:nucleotide-binding protein [Paenibacillus polysaccharolyticus]SCZ00088.1 Predicted nucleotide-binding protein containing TIR-like domain-containing protein [Paenibacillus polysaccharolyticus]
MMEWNANNYFFFDNYEKNNIVNTIKGVNTLKNNNVFVIHGRNEMIRKELFSFLRSIGLKPIEWTKAIEWTGKGSPHVGEILQAAFNNVQSVVALHTPDDEGRLKEEFHQDGDAINETVITPQARQNVILETGIALGLHPDRTIIVEIGKLRPVSDLAGVSVIKLNNGIEKRQALANRLKTSGCEIDIDGTDWHSSGNFDLEGKGTEPSDSMKIKNKGFSTKRFGRCLRVNTNLNNWVENVKEQVTEKIIYEHIVSKPSKDPKVGEVAFVLDENNEVHLYGLVQNFRLKKVDEILQDHEAGTVCGLSKEELVDAVKNKSYEGDMIFCTTIKVKEYFKTALYLDDFCQKYGIKKPAYLDKGIR